MNTKLIWLPNTLGDDHPTMGSRVHFADQWDGLAERIMMAQANGYRRSTPQHPLSQPGLTRRQFLVLSGAAAAWFLAKPLGNNARVTGDRAEKWAPHPTDLAQWRYLAGRIADGSDDFGFVVAMADNVLTGSHLLVQRKSLNGDQAFVGGAYAGSLDYNAASATYTFQDVHDQTLLATWSWSEADQQYALTVTTSELTLNDIVLKPQGDLIAEGGDGEIQVGRINGYLIDSDYHADWATIAVGEQPIGTARIDMQGLRLSSRPPTEASAYAHRWFAVAVELQDETPAWVSAWRIEALEGPYWTVTIARGSGATWQIERSLTEGTSTLPLTVEVLKWQPFPQNGSDTKYTGRAWRLTAPDGSLNLEIAVTPGQFIRDNPLSGLGGPEQMQEAIGLDVRGTILNQGINTVHLAVAESTAAFDQYFNFLPTLFK